MAVLAYLEATGGPGAPLSDLRRGCGQPPRVGGQHPVGEMPGKGTMSAWSMPMTAVRVLVVDDQLAYRRALAAVVAETDGFAMVGGDDVGRGVIGVAGRCTPTWS